MKPVPAPWTVQEAKARLSELLRRARAGSPQRIGAANDPCVLVSESDWQAMKAPAAHLGRWLVDHAPRATELELPSRTEKRRPDPFKKDR